jgi:uncharacterized protein with ParB-like and HNH nuclease domain
MQIGRQKYPTDGHFIQDTVDWQITLPRTGRKNVSELAERKGNMDWQKISMRQSAQLVVDLKSSVHNQRHLQINSDGLAGQWRIFRQLFLSCIRNFRIHSSKSAIKGVQA